MTTQLLKFDNGDWIDPEHVTGVAARNDDKSESGGAVCLVYLKNGHASVARYATVRDAQTVRDSFAIEINEERARAALPPAEVA